MAHKNVDYKPEDIQFPNQKIVQSELVHEMQSSYIEYAMSVIVGRALPDVEMLRGISEALHRDMLCFFGTPQGEDEQRCSCIRMIEDLCGEKDTAHFAWQEDVPSGADYQGGIYVSGDAL